jgi:hypothetical protein
LRITPKVGPLRPLAFAKLTPETEKLYMASVNSTIASYRELLAEVNAGNLALSNDNLDVGSLTAAGKYRLTDAAYSELLDKLDGHYTEIPQELRSDILAFYRDRDAPISTRANQDEWTRVLKELNQLQSVDTDLRQAAVTVAGAPSSR